MITKLPLSLNNGGVTTPTEVLQLNFQQFQFFIYITLLLSNALTWSRNQSGRLPDPSMRSLIFLSGAMSSISMLKVSSWPRSNLFMRVKTFNTGAFYVDLMRRCCRQATCLHSSAAASPLCCRWPQTHTCRSVCLCLRSAHPLLPRSPHK